MGSASKGTYQAVYGFGHPSAEEANMIQEVPQDPAVGPPDHRFAASFRAEVARIARMTPGVADVEVELEDVAAEVLDSMPQTDKEAMGAYLVGEVVRGRVRAERMLARLRAEGGTA